MVIGKIIKLTPEIIKDISQFIGKQIPMKHIQENNCFSDPRELWTCRPEIPNEDGQCGRVGERNGTCHAYHACHAYKAARLGINIDPGIDFEYGSDEWNKALAFAKRLTW